MIFFPTAAHTTFVLVPYCYPPDRAPGPFLELCRAFRVAEFSAARESVPRRPHNWLVGLSIADSIMAGSLLAEVRREGLVEDDEFPLVVECEDSDDELARPAVKARRAQAWTPHFSEQIDHGQTHFEFASCGKTTRVGLEYLRHGTGSSVWDSAVVLMSYFENQRVFPLGFWQGKRVLELGSGTGILGIHAAKLGAARVVLSDLGEIVASLERNIALNAADFPPGTEVCAVSLPWGTPMDGIGAPFDVVLCADCILPYAAHTMALLCDTFVRLCDANPDTHILMAYEERFDASPFFASLASLGFERVAALPADLHPVYQAEQVHVLHIRRPRRA